MTIEEKAKEYESNIGSQDYVPTEIEEAFEAGANWMLEKAIDWLQYHVNDYLFNDGTPERPWLKCSACMFDAFKKAMEK